MDQLNDAMKKAAGAAGVKLTEAQEQGLLDAMKAELAQYIEANGRDVLAAFCVQYTNFIRENPDTDKRFKWRAPLALVVSPFRSEFALEVTSTLTTKRKLASEGQVVQLGLGV